MSQPNDELTTENLLAHEGMLRCQGCQQIGPEEYFSNANICDECMGDIADERAANDERDYTVLEESAD